MSSFCYIENDDKTINYVKLTIDALLNKKPILTVDNLIQCSEIQTHCNSNNDWDKEKLMCDWVCKYGKPFRNYLNTIKVISLFIICSHKDIEKLTLAEFEDIRHQINGHGELLDTIF